MIIIRDYWGDIRIIWSREKLTEEQLNKVAKHRHYLERIFDYRFGFGYIFKL